MDTTHISLLPLAGLKFTTPNGKQVVFDEDYQGMGVHLDGEGYLYFHGFREFFIVNNRESNIQFLAIKKLMQRDGERILAELFKPLRPEL